VSHILTENKSYKALLTQKLILLFRIPEKIQCYCKNWFVNPMITPFDSVTVSYFNREKD